MTFENYQYTRPNVDDTKTQLSNLVTRLIAANSTKETLEFFNEYNKLREHLETMSTLVEIRATIDTTDKFYEGEREFWDEFTPELASLQSKFDKEMYNSKFKDELKKEIGEHYFNLIETTLKVFSDEIIDDLKEENKLSSEYTKLTSSAKIPFDGGEHNLSAMAKYTQDANREIRHAAAKAVAKFFKDNLEQYDSIYDRMIKVRTRIAKKLGFENFVEVAYLRLRRTDYNAKDVANYRKQILEEVVPLVEKIKKEQAKRLGLESLSFHDEGVNFKSGNPTPKGDRPYLVNAAKTMYKELSSETDEFFTFMTENNLLDLDTKPGKAGGGYCTFLADYKAPFIFANFNGTPHDAEVLTHEAGHAFQVYESRNYMPDYVWPTYEACEIHSMSMEYLTWPWMELFFGKNTNKFKYSALKGALTFIPYGVTIDHFQHYVYENPNATPAERRKKYHELELMYKPDLDYDNAFYDSGAFWFAQGHVFWAPFYYIDYTLAQVCAFQYLLKYLDNKEETLKEYITLCKAGGSESFFKLLEIGKLKNPMNTDILEEIVPKLEELLKNIEV